MIDNIKVDIYNRDVAFLVEVTPEEFDRFCYNNVGRITDEEYKGIREDILAKGKVGGSTWWLDSGMPLLYLRKGNSDMFVSHEIFHVCNRILHAAGVTWDEYAEPWAYLIGWMTEQYYLKYWEWKDSKKEKRK